MNQPIPLEFPDAGVARTYISKVVSFADACNKDSGLRSRAQTEPLAVLAESGVVLPPGVEACIVENTQEVFHLALPPDPNVYVTDEELAVVAGGKTAGSVGTAGTGGCVGTVPSCTSSVSTAGTAGTIGSAS